MLLVPLNLRERKPRGSPAARSVRPLPSLVKLEICACRSAHKARIADRRPRARRRAARTRRPAARERRARDALFGPIGLKKCAALQRRTSTMACIPPESGKATLAGEFRAVRGRGGQASRSGNGSSRRERKSQDEARNRSGAPAPPGLSRLAEAHREPVGMALDRRIVRSGRVRIRGIGEQGRFRLEPEAGREGTICGRRSRVQQGRSETCAR